MNTELISSTLHRLHGLGVVSVAAVEGGAHGGGAELSVSCDRRVVGDGASIRFVHATMALVPGWGGGCRLTQLVGRSATPRVKLSCASGAPPRPNWPRRSQLLLNGNSFVVERRSQNRKKQAGGGLKFIALAAVCTFAHLGACERCIAMDN